MLAITKEKTMVKRYIPFTETLKDSLFTVYKGEAKSSGRYEGATQSQINQYELALKQQIETELTILLAKLDEEIGLTLNPSNDHPSSPISIWYDDNS